MKFSLQRQGSRNTLISSKRKVVIRNRGHLIKEEYLQYRQSRYWPDIEPLSTSSISDLSEVNFFLNLTPIQRDYVLLLAFLQRVSLPFDLVFPTKIIFEKFPFYQLPNFQYFDELYDRHYPALYPMDSEKMSNKSKRKIPIVRAVACLWFAGYSLKGGAGRKTSCNVRYIGTSEQDS